MMISCMVDLKKLYDKYINGTLNESIAKRCCDF